MIHEKNEIYTLCYLYVLNTNIWTEFIILVFTT